METFSALLALCERNSPVTNGFRDNAGPVTKSFEVFFDPRMNKRFSKQTRRRWFETPSRLLWRNCNDMVCAVMLTINFHHIVTVASPHQWTPWRLSLPSTQRFIPHFLQCLQTKKIKAPHWRVLCEDNPSITDGIPAQRANSANSVIMSCLHYDTLLSQGNNEWKWIEHIDLI